MEIKKAEFIISAARPADFYKTDRPVIAVAGKSNVGKSSFINMLANRNKLARTSNSPGRTRLVNYFDLGEFVLADLPGYGFAQVSKTEKQRWSQLMEYYFAESAPAHVFSLLDIRHKPTAEDVQMINFLYHYALPFSLVATKADKLGKSKVKPRIQELAAEIKVAPANIIASSAETGRGRAETLDKIAEVIALYNQEREQPSL